MSSFKASLIGVITAFLVHLVVAQGTPTDTAPASSTFAALVLPSCAVSLSNCVNLTLNCDLQCAWSCWEQYRQFQWNFHACSNYLLLCCRIWRCGSWHWSTFYVADSIRLRRYPTVVIQHTSWVRSACPFSCHQWSREGPSNNGCVCGERTVWRSPCLCEDLL